MRLISICWLVVLLAGCSSPEEKAKAGAKKLVQKHVDMLAELNGLSSVLKAGYAKTFPSMGKEELANYEVEKFGFDPEFSWNVKKTDSLVVPFTAFLEVAPHYAVRHKKNEWSAFASSGATDPFRVDFAFQDGKWQRRGWTGPALVVNAIDSTPQSWADRWNELGE